MSDSVIISGFGRTSVNGEYLYIGEKMDILLIGSPMGLCSSIRVIECHMLMMAVMF